MISSWLLGFIVGILLGKTQLFLYLQSSEIWIVTGIILIPLGFAAAKKFGLIRTRFLFILIAMLGGFWGSVHSAPSFSGPCTEFKTLRVNPLQVSRGQAIVSIGGVRYEIVLNASQTKVRGRSIGSGFLWDQIINSRCGEVAQESPSKMFRSKILEHYLRSGGSRRLLGWIGAAVLGSRGELSYRTVNAFRDTGLIHLLVVSGLHVGLIATFVLFILRAPAVLLYAALCFSPRVWRRIATITEILSAGFVVVYVVLIGAPQSAQRAALFFIVWVLCKNVFGVGRPSTRFLLCMFFQSVIFPIGLLSAGNIMSWIATLYLVTHHRNQDAGMVNQRILFDWRLQLKILCLASVVFTNVSPLGLPANLVLAPVFGVILYLTCFNLVFPHHVVSTATWEVVRAYISLVEKIAGFGPIISELTDGCAPFVCWIRIICLIYSALAVLNSLRILTIRSTDD